MWEFEVPVERRLLLVQMVDRSPLERAGLRGAQQEAISGNQRIFIGGDVLLAIDGVEVTRFETMETFLEDNYQVGDQVVVTYLRDGVTYEVAVALGEEPR